MTVTPINNPNVTTYASRTPYLTSAEYLASPTGVDASQIVVKGNAQQNADALAQCIARASSAIDRFCHQVIAATLDTQVGTYRLQRGGVVKIVLDQTPVLQIINIAVAPSWSVSSLTNLTDLSNVLIQGKTITVPVYTIPTSTAPSYQGGYGTGDSVYAVTTYVNGFTNGLLASSVTAGGSTFTMNSTLGLFAGQTPTFYDPGNTETVTILSVSGNTVTISGTFQFNHAAGVAVSTLPPYVKEAAVLYTNVFIKQRASSSFILPAVNGQPAQMTKGDVSTDEQLAQSLLVDLVRVV